MESVSMSFLERIEVFQEKLPDITSLDSLIHLSCSVLDASMYICDRNAVVLAHSSEHPKACQKWRSTIAEGQMDSKILKSTLVPKPLCNIIPEPMCEGTPCVRLSFPIKIGENEQPGILIFFFWSGTISEDERYLATVIAGTFAHFLKNRHALSNPHVSKIQLFRELLQYKPGLKSYYESHIATEHLNTGNSIFRLVRIPLNDSQQAVAGTLAIELQYQLHDAWVFTHHRNLLIFYNENNVDTDDLCTRLEPMLRDMELHACVSIAFTDLLGMRHVFEDIGVICQIAGTKKPDTVLYRAEQYISLAFLQKCRPHFPLESYYPESFIRLIELDKTSGKDYIATLSTYLDSGLNVNTTAKMLFKHRSTVTQQLEKIQEILQFDLRDSEIGWYLRLCIRIHDLLHL